MVQSSLRAALRCREGKAGRERGRKLAQVSGSTEERGGGLRRRGVGGIASHVVEIEGNQLTGRTYRSHFESDLGYRGGVVESEFLQWC